MYELKEKIANFFYDKKQEIKYVFIGAIKPIYIKIYTPAIFVVNLLIWIAVNRIVEVTGIDQIALHYNIDTGIDLIGSPKKLFVLPILGILIFLINFFIQLITIKHKDRRFVGHVLFASALLVNIILLVSVLSLYLVNIQ